MAFTVGATERAWGSHEFRPDRIDGRGEEDLVDRPTRLLIEVPPEHIRRCQLLRPARPPESDSGTLLEHPPDGQREDTLPVALPREGLDRPNANPSVTEMSSRTRSPSCRR